MSWVTLDDRAPTHDKQIAAGPLACWLWVCCLAHCYGKESKDGFIPQATIKILYPGLGAKHADILVNVGLLEKVPGGYRIHDYLEWKERRLAGARSALGRAGGSVRSEAKRQAAATREATKRVAQPTTTTAEHNGSTTGEHNGTTTGSGSETTTSVVKSTSPASLLPSGSPSGVSGSVVRDPDQPESFRHRAAGSRPLRPPALLATRVQASEWEPLDGHWGYAVELGLTQGEYETALLDVRDKHGDRRHDPPWLDAKFSTFLETVATSKRAGGGAGKPPRNETPAERRTREQLERVERLRAEEAAGALPGGAS